MLGGASAEPKQHNSSSPVDSSPADSAPKYVQFVVCQFVAKIDFMLTIMLNPNIFVILLTILVCI